MSKQDKIESMVSKAVDELGTIDILFCKAGITTHPVAISLQDLPVEEREKVMNLN